MIYIPIEKLWPHPDNPRKDLGDLTELAPLRELAESIKARGVLQNLMVVKRIDESAGEWTGGYTIIIGHRRAAAAKLAGLTELPCAVVELTLQEQICTMLLENMQRSDLTVYEQAQSFQMLLDLGETVESVAEKTGFSNTTVRRRVKLLELDAEKFRKSEKRGATLKDYMELEKIEDPELKNRALDAIGTANFRNELKSALDMDKHRKRQAGWKAELAAFATEIERQNYIGETFLRMDYVRNYGQWSGDVSAERPADADTVRYYFRVCENQIDLYREHQEKEETEEDRLRRKAQEEQERREAELREIAKRHFALRSEFVSGFGYAKRFLSEICRYASNQLVWNEGCDAELLGALLGLDVDDHTDHSDLMAQVTDAAGDRPEYVLLACAYAASDGENNKYFWRRWNSQMGAYEFEHKANEELDLLYDFLISLGYETSDEEKAMRDGTHKIFLENNKEAGA